MNWIEEVKPDMAAIEEALKWHLSQDAEDAYEICAHLLFSPGKRIRPLLAVLSARLGGNESQSLTLASAVEYLHTATLLHDDILDDASIRRGQDTANSIWPDSWVILSGDFLLARALSLVSSLNDGQIMQKFVCFAEKIIAGQLIEMHYTGCLNVPTESYYEIITGKTATLFKAACESGAQLGGLAPQQVVAMGEYGLNLGLAFQIEDDIIDYIGIGHEQGKKPGNDFRECKNTLPLILALDNLHREYEATGERGNDVEKFINGTLKEACNFIERYNGFAEAHTLALDFAEKAVNALATIPDSKTKIILIKLAQYVVSANITKL